MAAQQLAEFLTIDDLVAAMQGRGRRFEELQHPEQVLQHIDPLATASEVDVVLAQPPSELRMPSTPPPRRIHIGLPDRSAPWTGPNLRRIIFVSGLNIYDRVIFNLLKELGGWVTATQVQDAFVRQSSPSHPSTMVIGDEIAEVRSALKRLVDRAEARRSCGRGTIRYTAVMVSCI